MSPKGASTNSLFREDKCSLSSAVRTMSLVFTMALPCCEPRSPESVSRSRRLFDRVPDEQLTCLGKGMRTQQGEMP